MADCRGWTPCQLRQSEALSRKRSIFASISAEVVDYLPEQLKLRKEAVVLVDPEFF